MRRSPSLTIVWALCGLLVLLRALEPPARVLTWDVFGYYLYLPATFIHGDPGLEDPAWLDAVTDTYAPSSTLYQLVDLPEGGHMIKYTSGMAFAYAPFFFVAHALAGPLGHPADGFSPPYQYAVTFGCLLYVLLGLFLFRRVLLHFLDERWTAVLLLLTVLGTNFLHLATWDGTLLTHPLLFTLYAGLLLATLRWHDRPRMATALAIGLCGGAIALIRPPEAVVMLVPLLWGLHGPGERRRKWALWRAHAGHLLMAAIAFGLMLLPQAFYWKRVAGEWFRNSYSNNPGEGFDLWAPHIGPYLFSFRKGWLVYTPLMLFAIMGIPLLWKRHREAFWAIAVFLTVQLWVVSSWTTWWYAGGSFSARSMVPAYVLLALPLGTLLRGAWSRRPWRVPMLILASLLVVLNLFQTGQWKAGIISKERMTGAYYRAVLGRTSVPTGAEDLLLVERGTGTTARFTDTARYTGRPVFDEDFTRSPEGAFLLTAEQPFSPGPDMAFAGITRRDHAWLRTTATLWVGDGTAHPPPVIVMAFHHRGESYAYRTSTWDIPAGATGWVRATMDYLTPEVRSKDDNLKVYIWNMEGGAHRIGSLRVEAFERKD